MTSLPLVTFSPRVWGWSAFVDALDDGEMVLPTRVGMVRAQPTARPAAQRSPHACGDGPPWARARARYRSFSPRVWGWSDGPHFEQRQGWVLPTRVGMVRFQAGTREDAVSSPH